MKTIIKSTVLLATLSCPLTSFAKTEAFPEYHSSNPYSSMDPFNRQHDFRQASFLAFRLAMQAGELARRDGMRGDGMDSGRDSRGHGGQGFKDRERIQHRAYACERLREASLQLAQTLRESGYDHHGRDLRNDDDHSDRGGRRDDRGGRGGRNSRERIRRGFMQVRMAYHNVAAFDGGRRLRQLTDTYYQLSDALMESRAPHMGRGQ